MISPQRREWAEMRNDPSGFVPRKCEYDAHKNTGHHTHRRALSLHSPSNIGLTEPPVRFHRLYWSL